MPRLVDYAQRTNLVTFTDEMIHLLPYMFAGVQSVGQLNGVALVRSMRQPGNGLGSPFAGDDIGFLFMGTDRCTAQIGHYGQNFQMGSMAMGDDDMLDIFNRAADGLYLLQD